MKRDMKTDEQKTKNFFQKVYLWMFIGLIISGAVAFYVAGSVSLVRIIILNRWVFYSLLIGELVLVIVLAGLVKRISATTATVLFLLYCITTGLTISVIFFASTLSSIAQVFFIAAAMFGITALSGYFTKRDLTGLGQICLMGLFGLIIAMIVNLFLRNSLFDFITALIGVVIFTGLTAYDVQKLKKAFIPQTKEESEKRAIIGALTLYLDFINLFLNLLRLFGKRR